MKTSPHFSLVIRLIALAVLASAPAAAQSILPPLPGASATGNGVKGKTRNAAASSIASALASDNPLIQRGPIAVRPHVTYRMLYGTDVQAGPRNQRDTVIQSFAPGALVNLGKYWMLDYTPTWTFYSDKAFTDSLDQGVVFSGQVPHAHGKIGATQTYESSHTLIIETGRQTSQESFSSGVDGSYQLGERTQIEGSASRSARYPHPIEEAPEWTTSDWIQWTAAGWLNYGFSPRFQAGIGGSIGYAEISVGSDMRFVTPQARLRWTPSDRIAVTAQAGQEDRRFESGGHPPLKSPVYSLSSSYQVLPTTKLSVTGTRAISASYFANEVTKGSSWSFGVEQRLIRRLYLEATYIDQDTEFLATQVASVVRRNDDYRSVHARLTAVLLRRISASLLFQTATNTSDDPIYTFDTHQYGIELGLRF